MIPIIFRSYSSYYDQYISTMEMKYLGHEALKSIKEIWMIHKGVLFVFL